MYLVYAIVVEKCKHEAALCNDAIRLEFMIFNSDRRAFRAIRGSFFKGKFFICIANENVGKHIAIYHNGGV
ncbi:MAG: hypothetical protein K0R31_88 [Clostridiales bacterium]|jgi:hypothetical protein|nr:hypothetical protein [Clostridiales bacterium]